MVTLREPPGVAQCDPRVCLSRSVPPPVGSAVARAELPALYSVVLLLTRWAPPSAPPIPAVPQPHVPISAPHAATRRRTPPRRSPRPSPRPTAPHPYGRPRGFPGVPPPLSAGVPPPPSPVPAHLPAAAAVPVTRCSRSSPSSTRSVSAGRAALQHRYRLSAQGARRPPGSATIRVPAALRGAELWEELQVEGPQVGAGAARTQSEPHRAPPPRGVPEAP